MKYQASLILLITSVLGGFVDDASSQEVANREAKSKVSFKVLNDTGKYVGASHVQAKGHIPLRMELEDLRPAAGRQLQVFIAIFERDLALPRRFKPGKFVDSFTEQEKFVATVAGPMNKGYERNLPLPKGEYIYYFYMCDPSIKTLGENLPIPLPDPGKVPGYPLRVKVCTATVD